MTTPAYQLAADAWEERGTAENPIRVLRHDARYVEAAERERTPRKPGKGRGMAVRSLADVERDARQNGGPKLSAAERRRFGAFNPGANPTDAQGRSRGSGEVQRARFVREVMARMEAGGEAMLSYGAVVLVSTEIVWRMTGTETRGCFRATCTAPQPGGEPCGATVWPECGPWSRRAHKLGKSCQRCARRGNASPGYRRKRGWAAEMPANEQEG